MKTIGTKHSNYVIRCTARSGSTYLCGLLRSTELAGYPAEYFNIGNKKLYNWINDNKPPTVTKIRDLICEKRSSDNGVSGVKIIGAGGLGVNDQWRRYVNSGFITDHWIRVYRKDKILQAISFYKAKELGYWGVTSNKPVPDLNLAKYNYERIRGYLIKLIEQEAALDKFFLNKKHLFIEYETQIVENAEETVYSLLEYIGVEFEKPLALNSNTVKTRNDQTYEWKDRFMLESKGLYDRFTIN